MSKRGHHEGTIFEYPKGSGRWYASLFIDGKRRKRGPVTRAEASAKLQELYKLRERGVELEASNQVLRTYLERWLDDVVRPQLRAKTYRTYSDQVRLHIAPALGHVRLDGVRPQHVQRLLTDMRDAGYSASTRQQTRRVLHRAMTQAHRWRLIPENPVALLEAPPGSGTSMHRVLSPEQVRRLLDSTSEDRLHALYVASALLGLRQGEALGLVWAAVDLEAGQLTVRHQLQREDGSWRLVEPKTRRSVRTVALPEVVIEALRRHRTRQREERLKAGPAWIPASGLEDLVFTTSFGTPLSARNVIRSFKAALESADLPDVRWHDLRHGTASMLAQLGVHQRTAMEILGHSTTAMTTAIYTHTLPSWQQEAASRMGDLFGRPTEKQLIAP